MGEVLVPCARRSCGESLVDNHRVVIERRTGRSIKTIMSAFERLVQPQLPTNDDDVYDAVAAFRKAVLDECNDVKEVVTALLDAIAERIPGEGTVIVNELWLQAVLERSEVPISGAHSAT